MPCRPAPACKAVLDQANKLWPHRSRASDGICASAIHHKQNPTSDHEPDVHGIAHAVDITHDPANGCDNDAIVAMLLARKDPRVKYLIHNRTIWRSYKTNAKQPKAWDPQPYGGPNPHTHHLHISVWTEHENDTSPWFTAPAKPPPKPAPAPKTEEVDDVIFTYRDTRDNRVWIVERGHRRFVERPELAAYIAAGVLKEPKALTAEQAAVMEWNYPEKK